MSLILRRDAVGTAEKWGSMGAQGKTGASGPRGRQGSRGATGPRGKIGKAGRNGLKGLNGPLHQDDLLNMVVTHFDDVYRQLNEHMKRIATLQALIDVLIAKATRSGSA
jgi:hypothetical protein